MKSNRVREFSTVVNPQEFLLYVRKGRGRKAKEKGEALQERTPFGRSYVCSMWFSSSRIESHISLTKGER